MVLFSNKSSGFEHDVVKRTAEGQSLSEATLTELGRIAASTSWPRKMVACSIAI